MWSLCARRGLRRRLRTRSLELWLRALLHLGLHSRRRSNGFAWLRLRLGLLRCTLLYLLPWLYLLGTLLLLRCTLLLSLGVLRGTLLLTLSILLLCGLLLYILLLYGRVTLLICLETLLLLRV